MNKAFDRCDPTHGVIVDIEAELSYWRDCFQEHEFHRPGMHFDAYVPTFKFGYDAYLLHHQNPLDELLPALKARYESSLTEAQRLEWSRGQSIIKSTWQRMHAL